jgi:hypothetical protein
MLLLMHLSLLAAEACHLSLAAASTPANAGANSLQFPFSFDHIFTAHLTLAKPLSPVAIPGGFLVAEPIAGGTVNGPFINGTIQGGIATPSVYLNGTLQSPLIQVWGVTIDGAAFVINEAGIGVAKSQVTRIVSLH